MPVAMITLHMLSMCRMVISSSRPNIFRAGIDSVSTIAKPEKIAPATKYGGKIVVCQPGRLDTAKSKDTTECTESTSGVARAASSR
jgi:hypothetical protein